MPVDLVDPGRGAVSWSLAAVIYRSSRSAALPIRAAVV